MIVKEVYGLVLYFIKIFITRMDNFENKVKPLISILILNFFNITDITHSKHSLHLLTVITYFGHKKRAAKQPFLNRSSLRT